MTIPFAVIIAATFLGGRAALVPLLFVAAVAQGASVVNVVVGSSTYGITPYFAVSVMASLFAVAQLAGASGVRDARVAWHDRRLRSLLQYVAFACVTACLNPLLFEGLLTFPLTEKGGFDIAPQPLTLSVSNIAQGVNSLLHCGVALFLWQQARSDQPRLTRGLVTGVVVAFVAVAALGLHDRLAWVYNLPSLRFEFVNNPGYKTYPYDRGFGLLRIYVPFTESSYLSTYCTALAGGFLFVAAFGRRRRVALVGASIAIAALANSLGVTGLTAFVVLASALAIAKWLSLRDAPQRTFLITLVGALVVSTLPALLSEPVIAEFASESVGNRIGSNRAALSLLADTYFLGGGLGSNRASGYLFSLLSAVGLFGTYLYWRWLRAASASVLDERALPDSALLASGCVAGCVASVLMGIPDLNFPVLWTFVFFAAFVREPAMHGGGKMPP